MTLGPSGVGFPCKAPRSEICTSKNPVPLAPSPPLQPPCLAQPPPPTMMGGGVQDVVDNYVAGALLSVEAALDDEMNRMQNLNVCSRRHTCPHTHCPAADACA